MRIQPETLKKLRKMRGWSQQDLADKAKIEKKTIGRLESGKGGEARETTAGSSPPPWAWEIPGS